MLNAHGTPGPKPDETKKSYITATIGGGIAGLMSNYAMGKLYQKQLAADKNTPRQEFHIFEASSDVCSKTSGIIPGRNTLGFHYKDTKTALTCLKVALAFAQEFFTEIDGLFRVDPTKTESTDPKRHGLYALLNADETIFPKEEILNTYRELRDYYESAIALHPDIKNIYGDSQNFHRLVDFAAFEKDRSQFADKVDVSHLQAAVVTAERLIDIPVLKRYLQRKLAEYGVQIHYNHRVTSISADNKSGKYNLHFEKPGQTQKQEQAEPFKTDFVANSAWEYADALFREAGFVGVPTKVRTNRVKVIGRFKLPDDHKDDPSVFFCMGEHAMFSNLGNGEALVTFAPVTNVMNSTDLIPPKQYRRYLKDGTFAQAQDRSRKLANELEHGIKDDKVLSSLRLGMLFLRATASMKDQVFADNISKKLSQHDNLSPEERNQLIEKLNSGKILLCTGSILEEEEIGRHYSDQFARLLEPMNDDCLALIAHKLNNHELVLTPERLEYENGEKIVKWVLSKIICKEIPSADDIETLKHFLEAPVMQILPDEETKWQIRRIITTQTINPAYLGKLKEFIKGMMMTWRDRKLFAESIRSGETFLIPDDNTDPKKSTKAAREQILAQKIEQDSLTAKEYIELANKLLIGERRIVASRIHQLTQLEKDNLAHKLMTGERGIYAKKILQGTATYLPWFAKAELLSVSFGTVQSEGTVVLCDPGSKFHERSYDGISAEAEYESGVIKNALSKFTFALHNGNRQSQIQQDAIKANVEIFGELTKVPGIKPEYFDLPTLPECKEELDKRLRANLLFFWIKKGQPHYPDSMPSLKKWQEKESRVEWKTIVADALRVYNFKNTITQKNLRVKQLMLCETDSLYAHEIKTARMEEEILEIPPNKNLKLTLSFSDLRSHADSKLASNHAPNNAAFFDKRDHNKKEVWFLNWLEEQLSNELLFPIYLNTPLLAPEYKQALYNSFQDTSKNGGSAWRKEYVAKLVAAFSQSQAHLTLHLENDTEYLKIKPLAPGKNELQKNQKEQIDLIASRYQEKQVELTKALFDKILSDTLNKTHLTGIVWTDSLNAATKYVSKISVETKDYVSSLIGGLVKYSCFCAPEQSSARAKALGASYDVSKTQVEPESISANPTHLNLTV